MKIMLNGQIIDVEETVEAMRRALIQNETEQLQDLGCDALESDEMAHELYLPLNEKEILQTIKQLEIK
jgi:hypothetical protein